jgi:iron complex transport system ATP-binding protein
MVALAQQGGLDALPFSVREYILMGRYAYLGTLGRYSAKDHELCKQALERVKAGDLIERPLQELSGGERQRVLLARVLSQATPLVLLDEPTAFLDADGQAETLHLMRSLAHEDHRAVLAVTHDLNLASAYADRIHLLKRGSIVCGGRPAEVLNKQALALVYRANLEIIDGLGDSRPRVFVLPD